SFDGQTKRLPKLNGRFKENFLPNQVKRPCSRPNDDKAHAAEQVTAYNTLVEPVQTVVNAQRPERDDDKDVDGYQQPVEPGTEVLALRIKAFKDVHEYIYEDDTGKNAVKQDFTTHRIALFLNSYIGGPSGVDIQQVGYSEDNGNKPINPE